MARAEHRARLRGADGVDRPGDPEVGHLRATLAVEEHILRLDVPVDDALAVCERERAADLQAELEGTSHRQRPAALDELLQVLALDELEDNELLPILLAAVDHCDDVRVRELRGRAGLAPETADVLLVFAVALVEDLQRDVALEQRVEGGRQWTSTRAHGLVKLIPVRDQLRHVAQPTRPCSI